MVHQRAKCDILAFSMTVIVNEKQSGKHKEWDSFKLNGYVLNKFCIEMILDIVVLFLCMYKRETNTCEYNLCSWEALKCF